MNSASPAPFRPEEPAWSAGRWTFYVVLVFGLHLGLFYCLSARQPLTVRPVVAAPVIQSYPLAQFPAEWEDPTIFAQPHPRGFAGQAWLPLPEINFPPFRWSEPARLLELPVAQLGNWLVQLASTNKLSVAFPSLVPPPTLTVLARPDAPQRLRDSTTRLADGLSNRKWQNAPATLPRTAARDGLTNTLVQLLVDRRGFTISAMLLRPGSGDPELDQTALRLARTARFNPVAPPQTTEVGTLIFEWAPMPITTGPAANTP
jgi:TonB family protein